MSSYTDSLRGALPSALALASFVKVHKQLAALLIVGVHSVLLVDMLLLTMNRRVARHEPSDKQRADACYDRDSTVGLKLLLNNWVP